MSVESDIALGPQKAAARGQAQGPARQGAQEGHRVVHDRQTVDAIQKGRRVIKRDEHGFDFAVEDAIRRTKYDIESAEAEVKLYEKVVANWRERPLPQARELQRGPGFFTKK